MTERPARDSARAAAQREAGLARVSAVTLAVGLAGAAGAAVLALELAGGAQPQTAPPVDTDTAIANSQQPATDSQDDDNSSETESDDDNSSETESDDDNSRSTDSNASGSGVQAPARTQPHVTSGGS